MLDMKIHHFWGGIFWFKIDFPDVISRKVNLIQSNEQLLANCPDLKQIKDINGSTGLNIY